MTGGSRVGADNYDAGYGSGTGSTGGTSVTPNPSLLSSLLEIEDSIRISASQYTNNEIDIDFGNNTSIVKNDLLADIPTIHNNSISTLERAKAIYRLVKLGVIEESNLMDYLTASNNYYYGLGVGSSVISMNDVSNNVVVTMPVEVIQNQNTTKQLIIKHLEQTTSIERAQIITAELYDSSIGTEERFDRMLEIHFTKGWVDTKLITMFREDINTEKIYGGDFFMVD